MKIVRLKDITTYTSRSDFPDTGGYFRIYRGSNQYCIVVCEELCSVHPHKNGLAYCMNGIELILQKNIPRHCFIIRGELKPEKFVGYDLISIYKYENSKNI